MVEELANLIEQFPGAANQTRCFTHILNLVVKSIIKQFDLPTAQAGKVLDDATKELLNLAGNLEEEDDDDDDDEVEDDNEEGLVDERETMDKEELDELDASVHPIRLLLTKVPAHSKSKHYQTDNSQHTASENRFRN